ncbi:hypothetical protein [Parafrankia sp. FMc2]|uniref:hypothetical protein n=1 Tax=Parafrankia sp. FMc2 TaxID=3233196 RepID=UPI0034D5D773
MTLLVGVSAAVAVIAAAVAVVIAVARHRAETHLLASRHAVHLIPTSTFDPDMADIVQATSLLTAVRPAVSLAPRRAAALRIRFVSRPGGRISMEIAVPANALSLVEQGSYRNVEHRRVPYGTPAGAPVDDHGDPGAIRLWEDPDDTAGR